MNKSVLGKVASIDNIDVIEKAFEGMVIASRNTNIMKNDIRSSIKLSGLEEAEGIIQMYFKIYNKLPFPLNSIEEKIKYSCIAMVIQSLMSEVLKFKVLDYGVVVKINESTGIYFSNDCWKLIYINGFEWDDYVDISIYSRHCAYKEYEWATSCLIDGRSLKGYYEKFMPSLWNACGHNKRVLKQQLAEILYITDVHKTVYNVRENCVLDSVKCKEYTIDIYMEGKVRTGNSENILRINSDNTYTTRVEDEVKVIYNFDVYEKDVIIDYDCGCENCRYIGKLNKVKMPGMMSIFEKLIADGIENTYNKTFRGAIVRNKLIFTFNGNLYETTVDRYSEPKLVGKHVDIAGVYRDCIYYYCKDRLESGVVKSTLYGYNCMSGDTWVCVISFE